MMPIERTYRKARSAESATGSLLPDLNLVWAIGAADGYDRPDAEIHDDGFQITREAWFHPVRYLAAYALNSDSARHEPDEQQLRIRACSNATSAFKHTTRPDSLIQNDA